MKFFELKKYIIYISLRVTKIISLWEKGKLSKYGNMTLKHQPVFIIGAPRTGSTILYQIITNQLNVLYVDNLICALRRNFFYGFWLSNKLFKNKAHNNFRSYHGATSKYGLRAPSECGGFWYRWLPKEKHFIDYNDFTSEMVNEIRLEITAITNYFDKPIIFNNNNIALRIRLINKIFPHAKYIVANRDPFYVAQSLLSVRKKLFGKFENWWSIMPREYTTLLTYPPFKQVVLQHYYINKQMFEDLNKLIDDNYYKVIDYNRFCEEKEIVIIEVSDFINYNKLRPKFKSNILIESKKITLNLKTEKQIRETIKSLSWYDYPS